MPSGRVPKSTGASVRGGENRELGSFMFRGTFEHTLDAKGRISVPRKYREELTEGSEQEVMLTRGLHRCLVLYPMARWAEFEERILTRSQFDLQVIRAKRIFVAGATECPLDGQGRILCPPSMRQYAKLDKDVVWVGQLDTIELWSAEEWERVREAALESSDAEMTFDDTFSAALAQLGL
ncbi:MAG: division/cell wall cluster transcriptional repressor MraZ [Deltaproteobacteria bacterium CG_4_9_14_3_um_filter_63_12]|nr:MAG: division/cell wall cluster transcriptional repressor MraZ [Deltaproteobacteria bacterium CG17_big_fil_post_rev_8_21_14_2_50_63_7]PJB34069.1 MAG: division/cell wall cluster transcriptional repressor MraZ [Deltaproteobacteria bacterium CG_4_9_14_3_um_filter_63_12]